MLVLAKEYSNLISEILDFSEIDLEKITEEQSKQRDPGKWSKRQVLGHLIDSAHNNYRRFLLSQLKDNLVFDGYAQEKWVEINKYQETEFNEIIDLWKTLNRQILSLISRFEDQELKKISNKHNFDQICMNRILQSDQVSLSYLVWDYIFHLEHHLSQILPNYNRQLKEYKEYN